MPRTFLVVLFSLFLLCVLILPLSAEQNQFPHALGVQVGRLAGVGASYQRWISSLGYQIATGAVYHPLMEEGRDQLVYNVGLELQYSIIGHIINSTLGGNMYLVCGLHHQGYKEAVESTIDQGVYTASDLIMNFGFGAGLGVETILFDHYSISTEFVYVGMYNINTEQLSLNMYPQLSLRYRF